MLDKRDCRSQVCGIAWVQLWYAQQPCCWAGRKSGRLTSDRLNSSRRSMHSSPRWKTVMAMTRMEIQKDLEKSALLAMYIRKLCCGGMRQS